MARHPLPLQRIIRFFIFYSCINFGQDFICCYVNLLFIIEKLKTSFAASRIFCLFSAEVLKPLGARDVGKPVENVHNFL